MTTLHGFELVRDEQVPEISTQAKLYRHIKTGAQLLSLENADENKVFGIGFFTPPPSSNGMTHIMEHSVLCASRKYPVKEPFVELIKSSLNTFLNAMTFNDSTWYPVASTNLQDLRNLMDVYLDCVFYPRLPPHILRQEGWHYELESADEPIVYKGVVFNEMKGNYSSPDGLIEDHIKQTLYPDTYYAYDSGGDPKVIPTLTYADFKAYHEAYYHPSNAMIYFYGDDEPAERLRRVDEYLRDFEMRQIEHPVPGQTAFTEPRHAEFEYAAGEDEESNKTFATVNWALPENDKAELTLGFEVLDYILLESSASPLRRALIESGLGEGLAGGGFDPYKKFASYSAGLKGIQPEDTPKVEALILDTLASLAKDGIEPEMIEAALNTIEFRLRENNTGSTPRGLAHLFNLITVWPYGFDPYIALRYEGPLNALKARLAAGERYFEGLIQYYFVENTHRATVLLKPNPALAEQTEAEEAEKLTAAKAAMTPDQIQQIIVETEELQRLQVTPDSAEALATIPTLRLVDMEKRHKPLPIVKTEQSGTTVLFHDLPTNGIVYLDLAFDMHVLRPEQLPYVGLMQRALLEMGLENEDYAKLAQRIGRKIGGLSVAALASMKEGGTEGVARLVMSGKATIPQLADLLTIARDVLLTVKFDNKERFKQIIMQEKARLESSIVPRGHGFAMTRLGASFNEASWANEQIGGFDYLFFVRGLAEKIETDWPSVVAALEAVYRTLVNRNALIANVTLDAANNATFAPQLAAFIESLPVGEVAPQKWTPNHAEKGEALTIPSQVNYVARGANLFELGYEPHGSVNAILNYTGLTYLWERVRVQGGAYGGFNRFNELSGTFAFGSYRDPNLLGTLDTYDGMADYLREAEVSPQEIERSIIGAVGDLDAYQLPDAKGFTSMIEYLTGQTNEAAQQERDELLSTSETDFRRFADVLGRMNAVAHTVVVGSPADVEAANAERGDFLKITKVL